MNLKENNKTDKNTVELVVEVKGDEFKAAVDAAFKKEYQKDDGSGLSQGQGSQKNGGKAVRRGRVL